MPIAKKDESQIKKVDVSNRLAPDALQTLHEMTKTIEHQDDVNAIAGQQVKTIPDDSNKTNISNAAAESDKKYSDTVIARLSKGKRNEFKAFFSSYGITMNSGIEMCIEYVMRQVRAGEASISKGGII